VQAGATSLLYITGNGQVIANASISSTSNITGAVVVSGANGGLGVAGNVYVGSRVGWVYPNNVSSVYQIFNNATSSLDTVFG
jgi:hypothetical protein